MFRRLLTLAVAALSLIVAYESFLPRAAAQQEPRLPGFRGASRDQDLVRMRVLADTNELSAGAVFHLVFHFDIEPKWHMYWKNPGAGAAPIDVSVTAPDGFEVKPGLFPRPEIFKSDTGDMYGYGRQVALFVPIIAPIELSAQAVALQYELTWAVCDDQRCVLQRRSGSFDMTSAATGSSDGSLIDEHKAQLPRDISEVDDIAIEFDGDALSITGPASGHASAVFLPNPTPGVSFDNAEITVKDDRFALTATVSTKPGNFLGTKPLASGLIGLGERRDDPSFEFAIPLDN